MALPDLAACDLEPIHVPGAIQPHGALLVVAADSLLVTHVSANLPVIWGVTANSVLGRPLTDLLSRSVCQALVAAAQHDGGVFDQSRRATAPNGRFFGLRAFRSGRRICIDVEPITPAVDETSPIVLACSIIQALGHSLSQVELCKLAVDGLRTISDYDRILAYRFHGDGHGEVIAECKSADLEPYLGLHYPATDIPAQARAQYISQRVGAIADSSYVPVSILCIPGIDDVEPIDLTHSHLRSVSPVHCQYMRNMGTAASLTISLMRDQELWGMLVCHHTRPRIVSGELRLAAGLVGQMVSLLLSSADRAEVYAEQLGRDATLRAIVESLVRELPLTQALAATAEEILGLVGATGAIVRIDAEILCLGQAPAPQGAKRALEMLLPLVDGPLLAIDDLGLRHPEIVSVARGVGGALLLPLAGELGDAILWLRPERSRTVVWGGDPSLHGARDAVTGRLSPRSSFAAWEEIVRGRSAPWSEADRTLALALQTEIQAEVTRRAKGDLARLRYFDPLTGLPNRRLLEERLREAEGQAGPDASLVFLDLDGFKLVNDTMGHAAGDALLVEVARRLRDTAGPANLVTRLGGDEFVVLCPDQDRARMSALGERLRAVIAQPVETAGWPCNVQASIGIAIANETGSLEALRAADIAMYAAKQAGGDQVIIFEQALFDQVSRRFTLRQGLQDAIRSGDQFSLLYQPLFAVTDWALELVGFEASIRWLHPRYGWTSPAEFISLAEESGLILPLGEWTLSTALRQLSALRAAYPDADLMMNLNVSMPQLVHPDFYSDVVQALEACGCPPGALCLEVVESMIADPAAARTMAELREFGVNAAIDDFGAGKSALSYLPRLPVSVVKLDRSFIENSDSDASTPAFLTAIVDLARAAGKRVVFKGIERESQFALALAAGADMVQGFLFGPPMSADAASELAAQYCELDSRRETPRPRRYAYRGRFAQRAVDARARPVDT